MSKFIGKIISSISFVLFAVASALFVFYNQNIIKNKFVFIAITLIALLLVGISFINNFERKEITTFKKIAYAMFVISSIVFIVNMFLNSAVFDYFQPYSLYDIVIYTSLAGYLVVIVSSIIDLIRTLISGKYSRNSLITLIGSLTLIFLLMGWNFLQNDFEFENIEGEAKHIFVTEESGYKTFRIPTMFVIPKDSTLADGTILENDMMIVMSEARRESSNDHGDIDLVQKRSVDGGKTWSKLEVVRMWEDGIGKIGNSTPVFDKNTGEINLLHIAGVEPSDYKTYNMISGDGGVTWSKPTLVNDGIVGPGHGIQISGGQYDGRLIVPGYKDGGSYAIYSDDNGLSWNRSTQFDDGNECEVSQINDDGKLIFTVRTIQPVSEPHKKLNKLFSFSDDGGETWSDLEENDDIKEPVCMSSITRGDDDILYYSYPNDYYSRSNMTIAYSKNGGVDFDEFKKVYSGPAGYSDLGVDSYGDLLLVFENGSVEYDERITLLKVKIIDN